MAGQQLLSSHLRGAIPNSQRKIYSYYICTKFFPIAPKLMAYISTYCTKLTRGLMLLKHTPLDHYAAHADFISLAFMAVDVGFEIPIFC